MTFLKAGARRFLPGFFYFLFHLLFVPQLCFAQVPNDSCTAAIEILSLPFTDEQDTRLATVSNNDPVLSCLQSAGGRTVWYTFTSDSLIFLEASTEDSRPFEYNTVLAVFSGACNSLVEIACNDDIVTGSLLQSNIQFRAEVGITYYIQVAESDAPGEGGEEPMGGDLKFTLNKIPLFKGPQTGSIAGGDSVSTDDFTNTLSKKINRNKATRNFVRVRRLKKIFKNRKMPLMSKTLPNSNFVRDKRVDHLKMSGPVLQDGFPGIPDNGEVTPPDPVIAAGPDHLVALVNNEIGIFDKNSGEQLLLIDPGEWFKNVFRVAVPCNPQIVYDHFSARWVMVWIECSAGPEAILLSVSDDSNPLGKWCNWRLTPFPDGVAGGINDLPKLGFDSDAIYVTTNYFGLSTFVLLRIIPKNQLLNNYCGSITWTDFWDLRNPFDPTTPALGTVPATTFGSPGTEYFVDVDFINEPGSFINLWSISDPLNNPTLTGNSIQVSTFYPPPNADQLGSSDLPLEIFDGRNHNAVFRNGSVWTAHSIADATGRFAQARYFRIDVNTATILEDVAFGRENFWYMYPVVMVDENENLFMSFTRSGLTEYPNARYSGRLNSDPPGLQASVLIKAGEDNYLKTFGSGRNLWGFYNGIALDPTDNKVVWMFTEYAAQPVGPEPDDDRWGTWIGKTSFVPQSGVKMAVDPQQYDFNLMFFKSANNQPLPITISSFGNETLIITNISLLNPAQDAFKLEGLPQFPLNLASFGDFQFNVRYDPIAGEAFTDSILIQSNDPENSELLIKLTGIVPGILNVDSETLDVSIEAGQTTTRSINIKNPGGLDLELRVGFTGIAEYTPKSASRRENSFSKENTEDKSKTAENGQIHKQSQNIGKHTDQFQESSAPYSTVKQATADLNLTPNVLFSFNANQPAGERIALGIEFDGTYFWVTGGGAVSESDPNRLFKYDLNGNLIDVFLQPTTSVFGWRDLSFDGTFLYGSDSQDVEQIDPATGAVTGEKISGPLQVNRALAYDPATDHFWTANFNSEIFEFDRAGNVINLFQNSFVIYGMAWDASNPQLPYLWVWAQFPDGNGSLAAQFDPRKGEYTGLTFDGVSLNNSDNFAGGAAITADLPTDPPNSPVFIGLQQDLPDVVFGFALPPSWLIMAEPNQSTLSMNDSVKVDITFDASGLAQENHKGAVLIVSNDFDEPRKIIDTNLELITDIRNLPEETVPNEFELMQNYPNPFNPTTTIEFTIPKQILVNIKIYNVLGKEISTLVNEEIKAGAYQIQLNAKDLPSGLYFYRISAGSFMQTRKLVVVK